MDGGQEGDVQARKKENCSDVSVFIEYEAPLDGQMALKCRNAPKISRGGAEGYPSSFPHTPLFFHFVS